jgi:signal peptidase I
VSPEHGIRPPRRLGARLGRLGAVIVWSVVPAVVIAGVAAYFGSAVVRGVYPPVVAVEGISMHPLLHAGDLVMLKHVNPETLKKGDIIAFRTAPAAQQKFDVPGSYVHRIVQVMHLPHGTVQFRTKGDNVSGADPFWTPGQNVVGEYDGHIPKLGYALLFLRSRQAQILAAVLGLIALVYFVMGYVDRRGEEREQTVVEFASMVDEVRQLARSMARADQVYANDPRSEDEGTLRELVGAVGEYGEHLRSHTAVMQNLAKTTDELHRAATRMGDAIDPTTAADTERARETLLKPHTLRTIALPRAFRGYDRDAVRTALEKAAAELESSERERCELVHALDEALKEQRLLLERVEPARPEPLPRPAPAEIPAVRTRWERLAERLAGRPTT